MLKKMLFISLTSSALLFAGGECSRNDIINLKESVVKLIDFQKKQETKNRQIEILDKMVDIVMSEYHTIKKEVENVKSMKNLLNLNLYRVKANAVNIRQKPSIRSKIIGVVRKGQIVTIDSIGKKWTKLVGQGYIRNYLLEPVIVSHKQVVKNNNQTKQEHK